jgi:hypothetical protein
MRKPNALLWWFSKLPEYNAHGSINTVFSSVCGTQQYYIKQGVLEDYMYIMVWY